MNNRDSALIYFNAWLARHAQRMGYDNLHGRGLATATDGQGEGSGLLMVPGLSQTREEES